MIMVDLQYVTKAHLENGMELLLYFRTQSLYILRKRVSIGKKNGRR